MNQKVIDLSHHNVIPESLQPAKDFGVLGCIHKLTEGLTAIDPKVKARYALAKQAGMLWGLYHFLRPGDIRSQAEFFLSQAFELGVIDGDTLVACDFEVNGISLFEVLQFLQTVEKSTGRVPVLYSGHTLKELGGASARPQLAAYRLWLAQYGPVAKLPAGYENYWLWQYSERGSIPGITGNVDLNHFDGTDEQLAAQWSGAKEISSPTADANENLPITTPEPSESEPEITADPAPASNGCGGDK